MTAQEKELLQRITQDPTIRFGKPCVRGLRITVHDVLEWLAGGMLASEILTDYPDLEAADIQACLVYAALLTDSRSYKQFA